ncbi:hypothetical protein [Mycolicibacterium conceptionense]|uniref:hypothetical protein n=1 Tax=Mycolicibacterium conceptionense TaxID=451644 RepID=UPI00096CC961|nr:hypothetical protein [Mycolicibacterium conceptionense]OMB79280.1 hypothetical protein A5743_14360 [Mycolicibacterium conceptionense]
MSDGGDSLLPERSPGVRGLVDAAKDVERHERNNIVFMDTITMLMGLLPILYGVLTVTMGRDMWRFGAYRGAYTTALQVPGSPESWGVAFIVLGLLVFLALLRLHESLMAWVMLALGLLFGAFSSSFAVDAVRYDAPEAWTSVLVYGLIAMGMMARSRLAWVSRQR